jgi:hypothetical protein
MVPLSVQWPLPQLFPADWAGGMGAVFSLFFIDIYGKTLSVFPILNFSFFSILFMSENLIINFKILNAV